METPQCRYGMGSGAVAIVNPDDSSGSWLCTHMEQGFLCPAPGPAEFRCFSPTAAYLLLCQREGAVLWPEISQIPRAALGWRPGEGLLRVWRQQPPCTLCWEPSCCLHCEQHLNPGIPKLLFQQQANIFILPVIECHKGLPSLSRLGLSGTSHLRLYFQA